MKKLRIILIDDHYVVRMGLASSINLEPDLEVVAESERGGDLPELYLQHLPDLVVLDWRLPDQGGAETLRSLRTVAPQAKVLVVSAFETEETIYHAVQAGANGYLTKSARRPELIEAIRTACRGEQAFPPRIASKLAARIQRPELTPREIEVIGELVRGNSNKEIGVHLDISDNTVKAHITHIMQKLCAKDRTHVASIALQRGIIDG